MISELLKRLGFTTSLSMLHIHRPAKLKHKGTFGNVCRRALMYSLGLFVFFVLLSFGNVCRRVQTCPLCTLLGWDGLADSL